jgi:glutamate-1-semialdehyde 2,1-aminomutase
MFTLFFTAHTVFDLDTAKRSDTQRFAAYFRNMLNSGIYLPPSQFEAAFLSLAHSASDIEKTIRANRIALQAITQNNAPL